MTVAAPAPAPRRTITPAATTPASPHWKPPGEDALTDGTINAWVWPLVDSPADRTRTYPNAADGALRARIAVAAIRNRLIELNMTLLQFG
jgi:hypothetical protein